MCRADQPEAVREPLVSALVKGFASHHAGLLPGWKGIVESLFQQGRHLIIINLEGLHVKPHKGAHHCNAKVEKGLYPRVPCPASETNSGEGS